MNSKKGTVILVTGATGHRGGAVVDSLLKNEWNVTALTRGNSKEAMLSLKRKGANVVVGDMNDRLSLDKALKGAYGVFCATSYKETGPEGEIRQGKNLADAAKAAGIKHFIFSSAGSADRNTEIPHFDSKREIEIYIRNLGLPVTILRPAFLMHYFDVPETRRSIINGILSLALRPEKLLQMLAVEDLGAFAGILFENPEKYIDKELELAGTELTMLEAAGVFSRVLGRKVLFEELPLSRVRAVNEGMASMYDWLNDYGFNADIKMLQKIYPLFTSLESWLRIHHWENLIKSEAA